MEVLFEPFRQDRLVRIELTGPVATVRRRSGVVQVLGQGVPADMEVPRNSALRPLLHQMQAVNFVDLFRAKHRSLNL